MESGRSSTVGRVVSRNYFRQHLCLKLAAATFTYFNAKRRVAVRVRVRVVARKSANLVPQNLFSAL